MIIINNRNSGDFDRSEQFCHYAQERGTGEVKLPPLLLPEEERRLYVRQTLREDHKFRIKNKPEGAEIKFDKLAGSLFKFFRGTALLYYRDYAGTDRHLPKVFTIGDVHPENFGVMPNEDGAPFFGVNDFDEAYIAPFSYDIKRGATGFYIATWENGFSKKKRKKIVKKFIEGYLTGLQAFARDDREKWHEYRIDNSPELIRELLESSKESRPSFLADLIDLEKERFVSSDEIVPHSRYIDEFQEVVDRYREEQEFEHSRLQSDDFFRVIDVAIKKDSGTASLGLDRYFILINGRTDDPEDDVILEMKQARRSALYGLVPDDEMDEGAAGKALNAHSVHLVGGDPFYGRISHNDKSFLIRERSPFKDDIDIEDLDKKEWKQYAKICGKTLAQTHARSDEDTGIMEGDAEKRILSSIQPDLFVDDVYRFAQQAAKRIEADFELFKKDHDLGAFRFTGEIGA